MMIWRNGLPEIHHSDVLLTQLLSDFDVLNRASWWSFNGEGWVRHTGGVYYLDDVDFVRKCASNSRGAQAAAGFVLYTAGRLGLGIFIVGQLGKIEFEPGWRTDLNAAGQEAFDRWMEVKATSPSGQPDREPNQQNLPGSPTDTLAHLLENPTRRTVFPDLGDFSQIERRMIQLTKEQHQEQELTREADDTADKTR